MKERKEKGVEGENERKWKEMWREDEGRRKMGEKKKKEGRRRRKWRRRMEEEEEKRRKRRILPCLEEEGGGRPWNRVRERELAAWRRGFGVRMRRGGRLREYESVRVKWGVF
ncbi:hypothetical protein KFK09_024816 [Dendrobium nobile]|uniref:Uncharacterized protein n=1 Tax=Dendrobium nobile TaxID=94219 RepID=A0A8T3AF41_DENNO|nr:hypothetical protein KFK09_024816 [Dendrobium nobile]